MDNDILINQARQLYAGLHARQVAEFTASHTELDRLARLIISAYCRYQRRLNRCVLCYQGRIHDCIREPGKKRMPCKTRSRSKDKSPSFPDATPLDDE